MPRTLRVLFVCAALACREAAPSAPARTDAPAPEEKPPAPEPRVASASRVTLLFAASKAGQLVPCGCSPDQRGGLPREVSLVKKIRAEAPQAIYVDAGDLLFESPRRPNAQLLPQKEAKARTLARGAELLGASVRAIGARDLALGAGFVAETAGPIPLLDAGAAPMQQARATLLVKAGEVPVGFFAAGLGEAPEQTIAARAAGLRSQGARLVVLLLHPRGDNAFGTALALQGAAGRAGVDLIVLGHRDDPATDLDRKEAGSPAIVAVEGHGQSVARVDVILGQGAPRLVKGDEDRKAELEALDARIARFKAQAKASPERAAQILAKVKELEDRRAEIAKAPKEELAQDASKMTVSFVPLGKEVGEDAEAQALVAAYDERVTEMNLAEAKKQPESCPPPRKGEPFYVGAGSCAECHQEAADFWKLTRHSHAYQTLVKVKKQFSLDCIQCHVTGWQQPNGVCRIDRTAAQAGGYQGAGIGRQDVQCEACHGPGSEHVETTAASAIQRKVPASFCQRCHEPANSPHFDDAKYRPFIVGPGHGEKLAKGEKPHPGAPGKSPLDK